MKKSVLVVFCLIMFLFGWFANDVLKGEHVIASKTIEYKVVVAQGEVSSGKGLEKLLNTYAKQGYKLNPWGPSEYLIFER